MALVENYNRHVFAVEAVQVTADNMQEIADWANGYVLTGMKLLVDNHPKQLTKDCVLITIGDGEHMKESKAYVGDWVLMSEDGWLAQYTDKEFREQYSKQSDQQESLSRIIAKVISDSMDGQANSGFDFDRMAILNDASIAVTDVFLGE